ncbi:MAG: hypothetical protein IJW45_04175 [Oscillospiraceae bacterium]|nr:hypothetical protein [Oscillospiraceae bacterium]
MGQVLYEVSFQFYSMYYTPAIVLLLAAIPFFMLRKIRTQIEVRMQLLWFLSGMVMVGALIAQIILGICVYQDHQRFVVAYQQGDYETVIGEVENFVPMPNVGKGDESFQIDGVPFSYSPTRIHQGYHDPGTQGRAITGNGQLLKVGYIEKDGQNYIVYIEQLSADETG